MIREMQIKIIMSYHNIPVSKAIITKKGISVAEDVEKRENFYTVIENVKCYNQKKKQYGDSSEYLKQSYHTMQQSHV